MFKRYKLKPRKEKPLQLRARKIGVDCRTEDKAAQVAGMLKNPAPSVKLRGLREAVQLPSVAEETVREVMKMSMHPKKEVRAAAYKAMGLLAGKTSSAVCMSYVRAYVKVMMTCTDTEIRKDGLCLVDLICRRFPEGLAEMKGALLRWLRADLEITGRNVKWEGWNREISKRIGTLELQAPADPVTKASHRDRIRLYHGFWVFNGTVREYASKIEERPAARSGKLV